MISDLDICKRIAEIESINMYQTESAIYNNDDLRKDGQCKVPAIYNPLTDDALCFRLMVKYGFQVCAFSEDYETGEIIYRSCDILEKIMTFHESPNKAICLAIIEAHNDT